LKLNYKLISLEAKLRRMEIIFQFKTNIHILNDFEFLWTKGKALLSRVLCPKIQDKKQESGWLMDLKKFNKGVKLCYLVG